jgi:hypothetical protein
VLLGASILATLAACGRVEVITPLPAHTFGPNIDSTAFEGILRHEPSCLYLDVEGTPLNILWPSGYRYRADPPAVIRADGAEVATLGDSLLIGGLPTNTPITPPGCPSRRGILLGIIESVNGVTLDQPLTPRPTDQPPMTQRPRPK